MKRRAVLGLAALGAAAIAAAVIPAWLLSEYRAMQRRTARSIALAGLNNRYPLNAAGEFVFPAGGGLSAGTGVVGSQADGSPVVILITGGAGRRGWSGWLYHAQPLTAPTCRNEPGWNCYLATVGSYWGQVDRSPDPDLSYIMNNFD